MILKIKRSKIYRVVRTVKEYFHIQGFNKKNALYNLNTEGCTPSRIEHIKDIITELKPK